MKLKVDEDGNAVLQDGHPVYIHDDGQEAPFDVVLANSKIAELKGEAKGHRLKAKDALAELKLYEAIPVDAIDAAVEAMETIKNLDDKKLIDAGKVESIKEGLQESFEAQSGKMKEQYVAREKELRQTIAKKDQQIFNEVVKTKFAQSKFFSGKDPITVLPPDVAADSFGKYFKAEEQEDGSLDVVGYLEGEAILSKKTFGNAEFDEAMSYIYDKYPHKNRIMSPSHREGGPDAKGNTSPTFGKKTVNRFDAEDFNTHLAEIADGKVKVR